jgi:SpoVK/Ycf46/Vps4 family AAA+-type ATPase
MPYIDEHESMILADVTFPAQINTSLDDIGGLRDIKETLWETILLPLQHPQLFDSSTAFSDSPAGAPGRSSLSQGSAPAHNLLSIPLGVLFYGPPGTGKTLMAKAIAKECKATFIPVNFSTLENKWYGESQKIARAIFSLARKFAPSIIFIDEVDVFLSSRSSADRSAASTLKGEFMAQWDGLVTDHSAPVLVLGATNRPYDIDAAFLRRMPRQILFDLPGAEERLAILSLLLGDIACANSDGGREGLLRYVVSQTADYSGSDLKELCKAAAMEPLREFTRAHRAEFAVAGTRTGVERATIGEMVSVLGKRSVATTAADADAKGGDESDSETTATVAAGAKVKMTGTGAAKPTKAAVAARTPHLSGARLRRVTRNDFDVALRAVKPTGAESMNHLRRFYKHQHGGADAAHAAPAAAPASASRRGPVMRLGGAGGGDLAALASSMPAEHLDAMIEELQQARELQRAMETSSYDGNDLSVD